MLSCRPEKFFGCKLIRLTTEQYDNQWDKLDGETVGMLPCHQIVKGVVTDESVLVFPGFYKHLRHHSFCTSSARMLCKYSTFPRTLSLATDMPHETLNSLDNAD